MNDNSNRPPENGELLKQIGEKITRMQQGDPDKPLAYIALQVLQQIFPDLAPQQILAGPLAKQVLGELPGWSNHDDYILNNVSSTTVGAFVVCTFEDKDTGETMVVMQRKPNTHLYCSSGGGFINLDFVEEGTYTASSPRPLGEQPRQGAARELNEEIRTGDGPDLPVLDLAPQTFTLLVGGIDYRPTQSGHMPVSVYGFHVELDDQQAAAIIDHVRLLQDPAYARASFDRSHGETGTVVIMSLSQAAALPLPAFAHPREYEALQELVHHSPKRGNIPLQSLTIDAVL